MYKRHRSIAELKDTRVKTTFKVEIEVDLPYFDNREYLNIRIRELLEKISTKVSENDTDGCIDTEDCYNMGHILKASYGYDEEEEYNIHDWDI